MAYNALNNLIDAYIYANGVQAITGQILNGVLKQMVSQLGSGYHLMGVAGPETTPEQNDFAMAYFAATAGEYTDFGGITLAAGEVAVLLTSGNGSWSKQTIYTVPTGTADLENTADFITNAVTDLVNYYTKTEVDDTLAGYPTLEALATALADYYTKTEIDTILAGYTTNTALASALADYYNKNDIDGLLSVVNAALADRYTKSETDTKLGDYYKKVETYDKDEVDSIVAALSRQEYIVAWDGLAAPDVSAIPAGVTVTYSGTTYTGTMAASASTVNKIYMVWNGAAYDMYGTSQDGGYSWVPMGTTTVDLSQYATKAEVSQLEHKVVDVDSYKTAFSRATSPTGSHPVDLVVNTAYYLSFEMSGERTFEITLRSGNSSESPITQTIASSQLWSVGRHIVPFVFTSGTYIRFGISSNWPYITNITIKSTLDDLFNEVGELEDDIQKEFGFPFSDLADTYSELNAISNESGYLKPDGTIYSNASWNTGKYDVAGYDFLFITGREYSAGLLAALYDSNDVLVKKIKIGQESKDYINFLIYCDGAKYLKVTNNDTNIGQSVKLISPKRVIYLKGMASTWEGVALTGWKVGEIMYNTSTKNLRRAIALSGVGGVTKFDTIRFSKETVYICAGDVYVFDGVDSLVLPTAITQLQTQINSIPTGLNDILNAEEETFVEMAAGHAGDSLTASDTGEGYIKSDGTIAESALWHYKKYDVSSERIVFVTGRSASTSTVAALFDVNNVLIETVNYGAAEDYLDYPIYIPYNAKYLYVSQFNAQPNAKNYSAFGSNSFIRNNLVGKKVAFIGDSITAGGTETAPADKLYHRIFAEKYGCTNKNLGVWSTCIANNTTNGESANRFVTRATSANLSDCSLVVVFGGTNDFSYDSKAIGPLFTEQALTPSGNIGDKKLVAPSDTDTFAGALHELIATIRTNAPTIPILFMTPLKRGRYASGNPISGENNSHGDFMEDFVDAIKKICAFYAIPVFDCNGVSQLDFTNADLATLYSSDNLHPNIAGHRLIGELLFRFVENNVYIG